MNKNKFKYLWPALFIVILLLAGCQMQDTGADSVSTAREITKDHRSDLPSPSSPSISLKKKATVNLKELEKAHPLYQKIEILQAQKDNYLKQLQEYYQQISQMKAKIVENYQSWERENNREVAAIQRSYQERIEVRKEKIEQLKNDCEQTVQNRIVEMMGEKQKELSALANKKIEQIKAEKAKKLNEYIEKLEEQYYNPLLNIKWKLEFLQLESKERENFQQKFKEMTLEKEKKVREEEDRLNRELNQAIKQIQAEIKKDLEKFSLKLHEQTEEEIALRKKELDNKLKEEIALVEQEMEEEISRFQMEKKLERRNILVNTLTGLEQEYKEKRKEIGEKISTIEDEILKTKELIKSELLSLINNVAEKQNLDIIFSPEGKGSFIDITGEILNKLK